MSLNDFWYGDPYLAVIYRQKDRLEMERQNELLWLGGYYNCVAVSTALSNMHFDGKHHKVNPYMKKPIDIFPLTAEEEEKRAEAGRKKTVAYLNGLKERWDREHGGDNANEN